MKSIALLTTALFLASAPSPDPATITEISAGFLSAGKTQPLLAAEPEMYTVQVETSIPAELGSSNPAPGTVGQ